MLRYLFTLEMSLLSMFVLRCDVFKGSLPQCCRQKTGGGERFDDLFCLGFFAFTLSMLGRGLLGYLTTNTKVHDSS